MNNWTSSSRTLRWPIGLILVAGLGLAAVTHGQQPIPAQPVQQEPNQSRAPISEHGSLAPPDRALLEAANSANLELATFALERGADPHLRDNSDEANTVLIIASRNGAQGIVRKLLKNGASPDATSRTGISPLMQAARSSQSEIARLLIEAGASVGIRDKREGYTALMHAAEQGNEKVLEVLLKAGADVNQADSKRGLTPLMLAANRLTGFPILLELLAAGADINDQANDGWTATMAATAKKNHDALEVLILNGANLTIETDDNRSAYSIAASANALKAMRLLTSASAQANDGDALAESLHAGAASGSTDVVQHLLSVGLNPDHFNRNGLTALHSAILSGKAETVAAVLKGNASPDARTKKDGHTALMLAANRDMLSTVELLLKAGANVDISGNDGWTAVQAAQMVGATDIVKMLKNTE